MKKNKITQLNTSCYNVQARKLVEVLCQQFLHMTKVPNEVGIIC